MRTLTLLLFLIFTAAVLIIFLPVISASIDLSTARLWKVNYVISSTSPELQDSQTRVLNIPKSDFWLAISKIGVISPVDQGIDFANPYEQKTSLEQSHLIHSKNSGLPGQWGTVIISSHYLSTTNWPGINPVYYFANQLIPGDQITIGFQGDQYIYEVTSVDTIASLPDLTPDVYTKNLILLTSSPFISGPRTEIKAFIRPGS